jgi:hypothetical protein
MNATYLSVAIGFLAALCFGTVVRADTRYEADRAYCNSSANQEGRALCLKEAAAAQGLRKNESSERRAGTVLRAGDREQSSDGKKDLGERFHDDARKPRGFAHSQPQTPRHVPVHATEPDKAPAPVGK